MTATAQAITTSAKDPVKASVLWKLRTGRAYTAIELAGEADVSKSEIHVCLAELIQAGLVTEIIRRKRGYYRLMNDEVTEALQNHYKQAGISKSKLNEAHHPEGVKYCRTCYHHLGGNVAVMLTDKLRQKECIHVGDDTHFQLTSKGESFFSNLGIDTASLRKKRSRFAKACIDFSERKYHLGGTLGRAWFDKIREKGWVQPADNSREVKITPKGKKAFTDLFQLNSLN